MMTLDHLIGVSYRIVKFMDSTGVHVKRHYLFFVKVTLR